MYKGHKIIGSSWQVTDSGHREPRVFVSWKEGQQDKQTQLVFTRALLSTGGTELQSPAPHRRPSVYAEILEAQALIGRLGGIFADRQLISLRVFRPGSLGAAIPHRLYSRSLLLDCFNYL